MKKIALLMVALLALAAVPVLADTIEAASKITAIDITGLKYAPESEVRAALFSHVGEGLDEQKLANDIKAVYALGYFEDVTSDISDFKDGTRITYNVIENPILKQVSVDGNSVISTAELMSKITLKTGQPLNYRSMRSDIESLNQCYKKAGYIMSRVSDVSVSKDKTDVKFLIVEGVVEAVTLEGNDVTRDYVILREMNTKAGSILNEEVLSKDLRRVFNLGFFSEITPLFEAGTTPDKTVMRLKLTETRTNTVNFGGGYGEQEGWFGFADLEINNLMGTAQGLMVKGQAGQQLTTYQLKYFNPWMLPDKLGPRTSFQMRLWNTMGTDIYLTQQDEFHVGWDATIGKTLRDDYQASFLTGFEQVTPRGGATFEGYNSVFFGSNFSYDTRDYWMNPSKGVFHTLSFKQGFSQTSRETTSYTKFGVDLNSYYPIREHQVLAWHIGSGIGVGVVPLGELYYVGGPTTVRGYGINDVHKGVYRLIGNLEYRYTFNDIFQGVIFVDVGDSWSAGLPDSKDFLTGWGPGLRLNTPMGPIRLDYGIGAGKNYGEGILHFSIGQAF
ncbi:MAG TPA: BamA/TamA family outer membrane protein [Candidatus Omnitrophota bacterium]|nr:BamA/TamA family outer membrane protein [Candidatus Omnitrophota bacterium]